MYYAHSKKDPQTGAILSQTEWQSLETHLTEVANRAADNAAVFGMQDFGRIAGLLHDLGKATPDFQARLAGSNQRVDHATAGAQRAIQLYSTLGKMIAYTICGHHGGLPDASSGSVVQGLNDRLAKTVIPPEYTPVLPEQLIMTKKLTALSKSLRGMQLSLLTRMLFSCLVDADYLDTEQFMQPDKALQRGNYPPLSDIDVRFQKTLHELLTKPQDSIIMRSRRLALQNCLDAAEWEAGLFSLTVPTGGGKTLSSLAFALKHALKYGMQRIIYAIPYTSIIEQNAQVLQSILGDDAILEHHSNLSFDNDDESYRHKLASENWDAPVVVTTNVQLFESLFAAGPFRARKLHNIANSVIILDEAQMLPDPLLRPSLAALKCLCADYNVTVVFCTATQPALKAAWLGNELPREIIKEPLALYQNLRRTKVNYLGQLSNERLIEAIAARDQVLCVVNTRARARKLYEMLPNREGRFHLSALMCPQHRSKVITAIKERLQKGEKCCLISTQLIEAGVDIDFPVVYREIAGADSIAQAAGRCNREGKLAFGDVYVFDPEDNLPRGWFQRVASYGRETIQCYEDILLPEAMENFFSRRYMIEEDLDAKRIMEDLSDGAAGSLSFQFREIEQKYRFIESATRSLIIPFDENACTLITEAESSRFPGTYARRLQRYSVSVYPYEFDNLADLGYIRMLGDELAVLNVEQNSLDQVYSSEYGLKAKIESEVWMI